MASAKKYLLVEIDYEEYDNDYPEDVSVNTKQFNLEEMLKEPDFRKKLMGYGWVDASGVGGISPEGLGPRLVCLNHSYESHVSGSIVDVKNFGKISTNRKSFFAVEVVPEIMAKNFPEHSDLFHKLELKRKREEKAALDSEKNREIKAEAARKKKEAAKVAKAKKVLESAGIKVE